MSAQSLRLEASPQLMDAVALRRAVIRLAHEVAERHQHLDALVLAGVRTRGVPLAQRVAGALAALGQKPPPVAALDPRSHRDDRPRLSPAPASLTAVDGGEAPRVDGATVVIVDDVLFTGRTCRAAIDALIEHGRPAAIEVLALVDRGHREIPIRATYVGKNVPTAAGERVYVRLRETDGVDGAWLAAEGLR